jgi:hypothetical protein
MLFPSFFGAGIAGKLGLSIRPIQLADHIGKPIGDPLPHNIVIHRAKLMPDPGLDFGVQSALRLHIFHDPFHIPQKIDLLVFEKFS